MIFYFLRRMFILFILFFSCSYSALASPSISTLQKNPEDQSFFKNHNDKFSYALGVSLGNYINQSFEKQNEIGITLDKSILLLGVQDVLFGHLKLPSKEIILILQKLEEKLRIAATINIEKDEKNNLIEGQLYMDKFAQKKGVVKTSTGLLYFIDRKGTGKEIKKNSKIIVNYKGTFINGVEFDNSYLRDKPISVYLQDVILGWQEGLKYIKTGGKITLVVPPSLAYGQHGTASIPGNTTIIFTIELLDVIDTV